MKSSKIIAAAAMAICLGSSVPCPGQITFVPDTTRRLTVTGKGEAQAEPDSADVRLGVRALDPDLQVAKGTVDKCIAAMLGLVDTLGIQQSSVHTTSLSVSPEYSYEDEDVFLGYEATRSLTVHISELDKLDALLDGAVEAGANSQFRVSLASSREKELKALARKRAIEDAKVQAQNAAELLGVRLSSVRSISLEPPARSTTTYSAASIGRGTGTFLPAEVTFNSEVSVVFLLEDESSDE